MLQMVNGQLVQVLEGREMVLAWMRQVRAADWENCVGAQEYVQLRALADADLIDEMDALVLTKVRGPQPVRKTPIIAEQANSYAAHRARNISRNWLRDFRDNADVPYFIRRVAEQRLQNE